MKISKIILRIKRQKFQICLSIYKKYKIELSFGGFLILLNSIMLLPKDMIVTIVAHRLSTIKDCDKIFVMDKGSIIEEGKHDILMSKKGLYFDVNSVMNKN